MHILRSNSRLRRFLGDAGVSFLEHACTAIPRILPHTSVSSWHESAWVPPRASFGSPRKREVVATISIGEKQDPRSGSLTARIARGLAPSVGRRVARTLDARELDICRRIVVRASAVLTDEQEGSRRASLAAVQEFFDEQVIADHLRTHHGLALEVSEVLAALHQLAEQTYENQAISFGCIIDPLAQPESGDSIFPVELLQSKKYRALSDGLRTAYHVSTDGRLRGFVDLEILAPEHLSLRHYYPEWADRFARASRDRRCGICLTRQGDILVFDEGTLRFTYRYGRWQYWNHAHLLQLLRDRARVQRVSPVVIGKVIATLYRASLDVSFRRSGALFVVLRNRRDLRELVRPGDAIDDERRQRIDRQFDDAVLGRSIHQIPRSVLVELASLDGAVVVNNAGGLMAYGAVLRQRAGMRLAATEGSRAKAALGASKYGLAVKISADGDITVCHDGEPFLRI